MKYDCSCFLRNGDIEEERWDLELCIISRQGPFTEFVASGHGSHLHAITGPQTNGNFLCLPAHGIGSELASFTDVFWNYERLSTLIGPIDATTLTTALKYLDTLV